MANYSKRQATTQAGKKGGYKPTLYFAPIADISTFQHPVVSGTPAPGDSVKVSTAHVFATGKTAIPWDAKMHSVKHTSDPVGDPGAKELLHKVIYEVVGDNPATFEQVKNMLNDQVVVWAKDSDCLTNDSYIQIGDDCVPVEVDVQFDGKTTADGQKVYTITFSSKSKVFYMATLDIAA